jgi:hypothetical protein
VSTCFWGKRLGNKPSVASRQGRLEANLQP